MSIKNITLVATAVATTLSFASTASAGSYFAAGNTNQSAPEVSTQLVHAEAPGFVRFYDDAGNLLDSQRVHAGANYNVEVDVANDLIDNVTAVLEIDGQPVATKIYNVRH